VHHLEEARALLKDDQAPGLDDYRDYLAHNELGLAFDVLTEVGAERKVPKRFWEVLREAGDEMCLTSDGVHGKSLRTVQEFVVKEDLYPCPCCGYLVFDEEPGSYDNCPVCGWEDDLSQLRFPTMAGANRPLVQCQAAFRQSVEEQTSDAPEKLDYVRDLNWRPLNPERDQIDDPEPGVDYGATYARDPTTYYYWRQPSAPTA
jgi:hypothetical protein